MSSWDKIFKRRQRPPSKADNNENDETKDPNTIVIKQISDKNKSWNKIMQISNNPNSKRYKKYKIIANSCKFDVKNDLVLCECGIALWKGSKHRPFDILEHIDSKQHKQSVTSKSSTKPRNIRKALLNATKDKIGNKNSKISIKSFKQYTIPSVQFICIIKCKKCNIIF